MDEEKSRYELFLEEEARAAQPKKSCTKCGEIKEEVVKNFGIDRSTPTGFKRICKVCESKAKRKYKDHTDMFWKYFWPRTKKTGDCLEWQGGYKDKYRKTPCCKWYGKMINVRRIIYRLAIGELPDDMFVIVSCGNYRCVRHSHLQRVGSDELTAIKNNRAPAGERHPFHRTPGLHARGERVGTSKLTPIQVREIRELYDRKTMTNIEIGKQFGVSDSQIGHIGRRQAWTHVE